METRKSRSSHLTGCVSLLAAQPPFLVLVLWDSCPGAPRGLPNPREAPALAAPLETTQCFVCITNPEQEQSDILEGKKLK